MFKRTEQSLPKDPKYPADLKELGYFITDTNHIRLIEDPEKDWVYFYTNNERHNDVRREAFQKCIRNEVIRRMEALGLPLLYVPQFSRTKPDEPSIPVFATSSEELRDKNRVFIIVGEDRNDLGILSHRLLDHEGGIEAGSIISFVRELRERASDPHSKPWEHETPGIIILNPGQTYYSHKEKRAMTHQSWQARPRKTALHDMTPIDPIHNTVEGTRNSLEHVKLILDEVLGNEKFVAPGAQIYVVGLISGATDVLEVLNKDWPKYAERVAALALVQPAYGLEQLTNAYFKSFLRNRAKAWITSDAPAGEPIATPFTFRPANTQPQEEQEELETVNKIVEEAEPSKPLTAPPPTLEDDCHRTSTDTEDGGVFVFSEDSSVASANLDLPIRPKPDNPVSPRGPRPSARPVPALSNDGNSDDVELSINNQKTTGDSTAFPTFSSGCPHWAEVIFPSVHPKILDFFTCVAADPVCYHNPTFVVKAQYREDKGQGNDTALSTGRETEIEEQGGMVMPSMVEAIKNISLGDDAPTHEIPSLAADLRKELKAAMRDAKEVEEKTAAGDAGFAGSSGGEKVHFAGSLIERDLLSRAGLPGFASDRFEDEWMERQELVAAEDEFMVPQEHQSGFVIGEDEEADDETEAPKKNKGKERAV